MCVTPRFRYTNLEDEIVLVMILDKVGVCVCVCVCVCVRVASFKGVSLLDDLYSFYSYYILKKQPFHFFSNK